MNTERLTELFKKLEGFRQSKPEATLLSIGGRGYYENPASDLLQFFLVPSNAHGLRTLFVDALLEVTGITTVPAESLQALTVLREERTKNGKRIDLLLKAPGWIILIENKIWHDQINPFEDYEDLAKQRMQSGDDEHYVILSPGGDSSQKGWQGLSYRKLIDALQRRLNECDSDKKTTKWWHFAQDFITHLDQELYTKAMTPEEIEFAEEHYEELAEAAQLQQRYWKNIEAQMEEIVSKCVGDHDFTIKDEKWAIRAYFPEWANCNIAWELREEASYRCYLLIYFYDLTQSQRTKVEAFAREQEMGYMDHQPSQNPGWCSKSPYARRVDSEADLTACATFMAELYAGD
jgi:hypothetical protein